jgi:hypothetical protein
VQVKASFVACGVVAALLVAAPRLEAQQGSLGAARELYAAAEYSGALAMLNDLLDKNPAGAGASVEERQSMELYRTLCLMAVGNTAEASKAIEAMVARDPLHRPGGDDIPPRVRTALTDARKRLLPSIIQQKYVVAKAAFDQKDFTAAADGFGQVLKGLADPDIAPVAAQPPLSDLGMLAAGFNDLTTKATALPPQPMPAPAPPPVEPPAPVVAAEPRTYGPEVVPPIVIRQEIPPFPGRVLLGGASVIEVIVDTLGGVEVATLDRPLNPQYDRMALSAARSWTYRPATLNGLPVKYRKRIQIRLTPSR